MSAAVSSKRLGSRWSCCVGCRGWADATPRCVETWKFVDDGAGGRVGSSGRAAAPAWKPRCVGGLKLCGDGVPGRAIGELCPGAGVPCRAIGEVCPGAGVPCRGIGEVCPGGGVPCRASGEVWPGGSVGGRAIGDVCPGGGVACRAIGEVPPGAGVPWRASGDVCPGGSVAGRAIGDVCPGGGVPCRAIGEVPPGAGVPWRASGDVCPGGSVAGRAIGDVCPGAGVPCRASGAVPDGVGPVCRGSAPVSLTRGIEPDGVVVRDPGGDRSVPRASCVAGGVVPVLDSLGIAPVGRDDGVRAVPSAAICGMPPVARAGPVARDGAPRIFSIVSCADLIPRKTSFDSRCRSVDMRPKRAGWNCFVSERNRARTSSAENASPRPSALSGPWEMRSCISASTAFALASSSAATKPKS